ncbi:MAG: hypothetical protein AAB731_01175 [Patescibacteria group bacterium]
MKWEVKFDVNGKKVNFTLEDELTDDLEPEHKEMLHPIVDSLMHKFVYIIFSAAGGGLSGVVAFRRLHDSFDKIFESLSASCGIEKGEPRSDKN